MYIVNAVIFNLLLASYLKRLGYLRNPRSLKEGTET